MHSWGRALSADYDHQQDAVACATRSTTTVHVDGAGLCYSCVPRCSNLPSCDVASSSATEEERCGEEGEWKHETYPPCVPLAAPSEESLDLLCGPDKGKQRDGAPDHDLLASLEVSHDPGCPSRRKLLAIKAARRVYGHSDLETREDLMGQGPNKVELKVGIA